MVANNRPNDKEDTDYEHREEEDCLRKCGGSERVGGHGGHTDAEYDQDHSPY